MGMGVLGAGCCESISVGYYGVMCWASSLEELM